MKRVLTDTAVAVGIALLFLSLMRTTPVEAVPRLTTPTVAGDYCGETADPACVELAAEAQDECMQDYNNTPEQCRCVKWRAWTACMNAFGCPGKSEQFMIENGCGPQD